VLFPPPYSRANARKNNRRPRNDRLGSKAPRLPMERQEWTGLILSVQPNPLEGERNPWILRIVGSTAGGPRALFFFLGVRFAKIPQPLKTLPITRKNIMGRNEINHERSARFFCFLFFPELLT